MRLNRLNQIVKGKEDIDGTWQLTPNHQLRYKRRGGEEETVLTGELVVAEPTALVFQAMERSADEEVTTHLFSLRGRWQADDRNRINFLVERQHGLEDQLTFEGAWELNEANEILYRYTNTQLKTKEKTIQTLRFQGYWDITEQNRLTYLLDESSDSSFRFRGAFQTPSILEKEGAIRYQIGIEVEEKKKFRTITLFGKWKLSRDLSLEFEIPYRDGSTRPVTFGAAYAVNSATEISAQLKTGNGKPLGLEVILTREFLKGTGQTFLRLKKSLEETAVEGGFRFRW